MCRVRSHLASSLLSSLRAFERGSVDWFGAFSNKQETARWFVTNSVDDDRSGYKMNSKNHRFPAGCQW